MEYPGRPSNPPGGQYPGAPGPWAAPPQGGAPPQFGGPSQFGDPPQFGGPQRPEGFPQPGGSPPPRRAGRIAAVVATIVLLSGLLGAAVVAYVAFHSAGDRLTALTPDNSEFYVTVLLDPSLTQKHNINTLAHKFPDINSGDLSTQIDNKLEEGFKNSGLSYRNDVKPWLGHQISVAGRTGGNLDKTPAVAFLIDASDEGKARSALDRFRGSKDGKGFTWTSSSHNGVTVWSGSRPQPDPRSCDPTASECAGSSDQPQPCDSPDPNSCDVSGGENGSSSSPSLVIPKKDRDGTTIYAVVNHMVVFGDDATYVNEVIDTAQGRHANLASAAAYKRVMSRLPADHVVSAYADPQPVLQSLRKSRRLDDKNNQALPLRALDAYRGVGMTLGADTDAVSADLDVEVDRSKLDNAGRASLDEPAHINSTTAMTPKNAYGVLAFGGARSTVKQLVDYLKTTPQAQDSLAQLGLTQPGGIVDHLSGDIGLEIGPGTKPGSPSGALIIGVDDQAVAQSFVDKLIAFAQRQTAPQRHPVLESSPASPPDNVPAVLTAAPVAYSPPATLDPAAPPVDPAYPTDNGVSAPTSDPTFDPQPIDPVEPPHPSVTREQYRGTTINVLAGGPSSGAIAVLNKTIVIAPSAAAVHAVIDAAKDRSGIDQSATYVQAIAGHASNNSELFIDIDAVAGAARSALGDKQAQSYDRDVAPRIRPLRAFTTTTDSHQDHIGSHARLLLH